MKMKETYQARGMCTNCGRRNYPQWGEYKIGSKLSDYPCPNCKCMTWTADYFIEDNYGVGKKPDAQSH